jgi:hypothetical protein
MLVRVRVGGMEKSRWSLIHTTEGLNRVGRSICRLLMVIAASACASQPTIGAPAAAQDSALRLSQDGVLARVSVGTSPSATIAPKFMGLAHEWGDAQDLMGSADTGANGVYRELLSNLTAYGSGPVVIRVGGNSTDKSSKPTESEIRPFAELAEATGAHFYLGVNLGGGDVRLAADQAALFYRSMPPNSLDAIEIGNEPDDYRYNGIRPRGYRFPDYLSEFDRWRVSIASALRSGVGLIGPSWGDINSLSDESAFIRAEGPNLAAISQHYYLSDACSGKVLPADLLLNPASAIDGPDRMRAAAATAHEYHLPFRVNEINSISCGGKDGISNAFGSALWAIDVMFEFANAGVDGVNWQSPNGAAYSPFQFVIEPGKAPRSYHIKSIRPLYYGMLFFQAATGEQSRILPVAVLTGENFKAWATVDGAHTQRVVALNKSAATGRVLVAVPGCHSASLVKLTAPSVGSKIGIRFAGQTMDGSLDGKLQGPKHIDTIHSAGDLFEIPMEPYSAFIVQCGR